MDGNTRLQIFNIPGVYNSESVFRDGIINMARYMMAFADCLGWMCYNGGTMILKSCDCKCPSLFSGPRCHIRKLVKLIEFTYSGKQRKQEGNWNINCIPCTVKPKVLMPRRGGVVYDNFIEATLPRCASEVNISYVYVVCTVIFINVLGIF